MIRSLAERAGQLAYGTEEQAYDEGDAVVQKLPIRKLPKEEPAVGGWVLPTCAG